jgi:hypothetical protein
MLSSLSFIHQADGSKNAAAAIALIQHFELAS